MKTTLLDDYVRFVDITKKQNKYFKNFISLICNSCIFVFVFCFYYTIINE